MSETAKDRALIALPYLKMALNAASIESPGAKIMLGVLAVLPDGSGRVVARLDETTEFLNDIAELVGVKDDPLWMAKP